MLSAADCRLELNVHKFPVGSHLPTFSLSITPNKNQFTIKVLLGSTSKFNQVTGGTIQSCTYTGVKKG